MAAAPLTAPSRVLIWTETHQLGGCDRYLVDLLRGLDGGWSVALAGNPNPKFDAWLAERVPALLPRTLVPVATLPGSPLDRLRVRLGLRGAADSGDAGAATTGALDVDEGPLVRRAAVAALRYRQLAVNVPRLRGLLRRGGPAGRRVHHTRDTGRGGGRAPPPAATVPRLRGLLRRARRDVLFINNGGSRGGESCRAAVLAGRGEGVPRIVHFVHNMASPPLWPAGVERRYDRRLDAATSA